MPNCTTLVKLSVPGVRARQRVISEEQANRLIPEEHLTSSLSPLWRKRFRRAIDYLHDTLEQNPPPSWDEVAAHAAISPYHFHRMFRLIFQEPPGQYLRRMRLQEVIFSLINRPKAAVTEIALECGFSSSQSLAKALRRELNTSAKTIRADYLEKGWQEVEALLNQLGQPGSDSDSHLESTMTESLGFQIVELPERYLSVQPYPLSEGMTEKLLESIGDGDIFALIPTQDTDKPAAKQEYLMGQEVSAPSQANLVVSAGRYLSCTVKLNNIVAYAAVWDALYNHLLSEYLQPAPDGYVVEVLHQNDECDSDIVEVTFSLALDEL
ncbi:MAG: helix-turn-helix transcriptional regulator [Endozoicomonas sp.]